MDCIIVDDDDLMRLLIESYVEETEFLNLIKSTGVPLDAYNVLLNQKIDLVFLDLTMPGMSGKEFLMSLEGSKPLVIIVSANKDFAAEAYDFDVCDFIIKPISQERFMQAVSKAKKIFDRQHNQTNTDAFFIKSNSALIKLNIQDIYMIEALADYVTIHTLAKKYTIHSTMKDIKMKLPQNDYIRIHNSYIVRIDKIASVEGNSLVVYNQTIPVGKSRHQELMNRIKRL
ncbi:MAG: LytTR family DNA-binding domain-containing protein [Bacteroidota bacterium]